MAAKLTFQDVFNDEMAPEKFLVSPVYFSTGTINPSFSAPTGSIYVNTTSGSFFLNISSPTPGTTWLELSNASNNIQGGHHRTSTEGSLSITGSGAYTPTAGDLVGTFGLGAWTNGNNLSITYTLNNGCGTRNQALNAGGDGTNYNLVEIFNGSTWASTGSLNSQRYSDDNPRGFGANIFGSTNGAVCVGGNSDGSTTLSSCELYNGSTWVAGSGNVPGIGAIEGHAATGTSYSGLIYGNYSSTGFHFVTKFNGATWFSDGILINNNGFNGDNDASASGSVNAAIFLSSYFPGSIFRPVAFSYNGVNALYLTSTFNNATAINCYLSGNPLMAYKMGGSDQVSPTAAAYSSTEIFNGVTFNTHINMNVARIGTQTKAPGSATDCIAMGGRSATGLAPVGLRSTETYTETITYKKLYPQYAKSFNKASIYYGSSSALMRGYQSPTKYPANKYLVVNRQMLTAIGNQADISAGYNVLQVGVTGTLATYSISATPSLQIVPGNIAIVAASGANPLSANNTGIFIVKNIIISSNTIAVTNAAGTSQNPGTGTMQLITTMLCVDCIDADDIVIGQTDGNGILNIDKMFQTSAYFSRTGM